MPLEAKPVQVIVSGQSVSRLLDAAFLGGLSQELPGIKAVALTLMYSHPLDAKGNEHLESITFGHLTPSSFESQKLTVDTDEPETLRKVLKALEMFTDRGDKK